MSYEVVDGVRNGARRAWDVTEDAASNAKSSVESAAGTVAGGARSTFFDTLEKVTKVAAAARAFGLDDALLRVGLQRRRSLFADAGVFGAGFIAGAAVAAIATPLSGRALRRRIAGFFSELANKGEGEVGRIAHDARDVAAHEVDALKHRAADVKQDVNQTAMHAKDAAKETLGHANEAVVAKVHDITDSVSDAAQKPKPENGSTVRGRN